MTQVALNIAVIVAFMKDDDKKCDYEPGPPGWTANLSGSSTTLAGNLGTKPHAASESQLSPTDWPSQAHHLIPHLTLVDHPVSDWLKADDVLYGDTKYNVDHENNGYWMPYASSLPEWTTGATTKSAKQSNKDLMFKVMRLSGIQMHQGRHSSSNRYEVGAVPYKARVVKYLDKIKNNGASHFVDPDKCTDCDGKKQNGKYPPRDNTVRHVDKASSLIKDDVKKCLIFVSRIAAEFADSGGFK